MRRSGGNAAICGASGANRWSRGLIACLALILALVAGGTLTAGTPAVARSPQTLTARLTVLGGDRPVPNSFLGLSIEYNELGAYEREGILFGRVVSIIRPEHGGPVLLRVGGKSADHVYWQATRAARPMYVSLIGTQWLARLKALVSRDHLKVLLDLNLAVHSPALESEFVAAARKALPTGSLAGVEIGNEPDLYSQQPQLALERIPGTDVGPNWTEHYSPRDYRRDFRDYALALEAKVPGVVLAGPETIFSPDPAWLSAVQGLGHLTPKILAVHRYVTSDCLPAGSRSFPTIATMLRPQASAGLANSAAGPAALAHAHGESLHVTEVNSISCGGTPGVSDSFATALWAPDLLFGFLHAGVTGVNWETRPGTINTPFLADADSIRARPSLYGLAVFAQMTPPGAELLRTTVLSSGDLNLSGWAVRVPGGTRVLLINKGSPTVRVAVRTGIVGHAFLRRLIGRSVRAVNGITFGGQTIGDDGRWHGRLVAPSIPDTGGRSEVTVPGNSAALLSVRLGTTA